MLKSIFLPILILGALTYDCIAAEVKIYVPQVVNGVRQAGTSFVTIFHLVNLSDNSVFGDIQAKRDSGEPMEAFWTSSGFLPHVIDKKSFTIAPFGQQTIVTTGIDASLQVGWAVIRSSGPIGVVATLQFFEGGKVTTSTSILPDPPLKAFSAYALVSARRRTGIAILNVSTEESADIVFKLYDNQGKFLASRTISLGPLGKISQFLNEGSLFTQLETFEGTVEVSSSVEVAATIIRVDETYWSTFRVFPARLVR